MSALNSPPISPRVSQQSSPPISPRQFNPSVNPQENYNSLLANECNLEQLGVEKAMELLEWAKGEEVQLGSDAGGKEYTLNDVAQLAKESLPVEPASGDDGWGEVRTFVTSMITDTQKEKIAGGVGSANSKEGENETSLPPSKSSQLSSNSSSSSSASQELSFDQLMNGLETAEAVKAALPEQPDALKRICEEALQLEASVPTRLLFVEGLKLYNSDVNIDDSELCELVETLIPPPEGGNDDSDSPIVVSNPAESATGANVDGDKTPKSSSWTPRWSLMALGFIALGALAYWQKDTIVNWWQGRKVNQL